MLGDPVSACGDSAWRPSPVPDQAIAATSDPGVIGDLLEGVATNRPVDDITGRYLRQFHRAEHNCTVQREGDGC